MKTKAVIAVLGLAGVALALPAAAQMSMSAVYIGGGIGQSKFKDGCSASLLGGGSSCDDKDTAFKGFVGYQFNKFIAAEAGFTDLGKTKASAGPFNFEAKANAWELSAVGTYPVWEQLSILGRLGGYYSEGKLGGALSGKKNKAGVTFGLGAQYDFNRNLGLRAEWQRYDKVKFRDDVSGTEAETSIDVLGVSVLWRFQ